MPAKSGLPKTLKFAGGVYYKFGHFREKRNALDAAARLRRNGYGARIVERHGITGVYSRPDTPHWWSPAYLQKLKK